VVIEKGEKIHVIMRRLIESAVQRHFAGEVVEAEGATVRATGYVFIYDETKAQYIKKVAPRTTIFDLAESGYIVNLLPQSVDVADLQYKTIERSYLAVVDGKGFELEINEFSVRR
jgi:hypothetical protein